MRLLNSISVADSIPLIYPRLFAIHDIGLDSPFGVPSPEFNGRILFPPLIRASYERLNSDGVYFIEIGLSWMLGVSRLAPPQLIKLLFNVNYIEEIDIRLVYFVNPAYIAYS